MTTVTKSELQSKIVKVQDLTEEDIRAITASSVPEEYEYLNELLDDKKLKDGLLPHISE